MNPEIDTLEPTAANNYAQSELRTEIINTDGTMTDAETLVIAELRKIGWGQNEFRELWQALVNRRRYDAERPKHCHLHGLAWRVQTLVWPAK